MAAKSKTTKKEQKTEEAPVEEVLTMEEQLEGEPTIDDLPGVGPATAEKLREAGFDELLGVAVAGKIIQAAKKMANIGGFVSGTALLERRREVQKLSSMVQSIDDLLSGGFETQALVEVYGEFGSGKTQIGHQLAVNCTMPVEQGGLDGDVFYIDTEDTFRPERITQMARGHGLDPDEVLERIHVARAYNSAHQMLLAEEIKRMSRGTNVKMIIVDSLTSHFRAEFVGRGMLASRQQKLNRHLKDLKQIMT